MRDQRAGGKTGGGEGRILWKRVLVLFSPRRAYCPSRGALLPDILLATINAKWIHPSLALRLLRANLGRLEGGSEIAEFALRQPQKDIIAKIAAARPRVLGISVSIWNHAATLALLRELDAIWEGSGGRPAVVLGGPEVSRLPEGAPLLARCDWLVRGEGEHAFRELCVALLEGRGPAESGTIARLKRVETLQEGRPSSYTIVEAAPVDPETIDPGYRLYTGEDLERKLTYVEASRGCPFGCEFCLSSLDRRVRLFPLPALLAGLEELLSRGARSFKFLDRTFNLDVGRAGTIMRFFLERPRPGLFVHFEIVPSRFPPALRELAALFPPGALRLEAGIQTLDPVVAGTIGRTSDPELELETLAFLSRRAGATVHADLIVGLPGEDLEGFGRGFERVLAAGPAEIQVGILKRLPGAPIARHDEAFSMRYAEEPPYEVLSTSTMGGAELARLANFARFWELIANRNNFPLFVERFLAGGPAGSFDRFLELSDGLLARFGRNWGIDRGALRAALEEMSGSPASGSRPPSRS